VRASSEALRRERWWTVLSILGLALAIGCLAIACAPLSPLFDPDEGYYPATAAESLRSGAFWDLRFNDAPRWDKPILAYAFIQGAFRLFGENVVAARLPSAIEAAALIAIVGLVTARLTGARSGVLCAAVVGTTLGVGSFSRAAHPEIGLVLSVTAAELFCCLWLSSPDRMFQRRCAIGAGIAVGLGTLTKGPVAVVLPVLMLGGVAGLGQVPRRCLGRLTRDAALCLVVAVAVAAPWYVAMTALHGSEFLRQAVWQQSVGRYATDAYGHRGSVFTLCLPALLAVFPWIGLLPQALRRLAVRERGDRELLRTSMFTSALTALAFYSLSSSKLPSYTLICAPGLGIVIGLWLDELFDRPDESWRPWIPIGVLLGLVGIGLVSAPRWIGRVVDARHLFGAARPRESDVAVLLGPVVIPLGCVVIAGAGCLLLRRIWLRVIGVALVGALAPIVVQVTARQLLRDMYPWRCWARW
jgi:4-amino-4-deoxy-L-arabinose transferase-like glycosyltransferase